MFRKIIEIFIVLGIVLYLTHDVEVEKLYIGIQNYSSLGLIFTIILFGLTNVVLALRWYLMTNKECALKASYEGAVVTNFLNMLLPAKAGEISKLFYLKKYYNFKINNSLSILFVERLLDVMVLMLFLVIVNIYYIENEQIKIALIIILFFMFSFFVLLKTKILLKIFYYIPFRLISIFGRKIIKNINIQFRKESLFKTLLTTIVLWGLYFFIYWIFFGLTVNFSLSFYEIFMFFVVATVALAIPLTPGGVGTFQASIVFVGNMLNIPKEDSLLAGIVLYLIMVLVDVVLFYTVILSKKIKIKDIFRR